jgi:hypothetical protein
VMGRPGTVHFAELPPLAKAATTRGDRACHGFVARYGRVRA